MDNLANSSKFPNLSMLDDPAKDGLRILKSFQYNPQLQPCLTSEQSLAEEIKDIINSQKAELIKSVDGIICFKIVSALDQELKQAWVLDLKQGDFKDGIDEKADCIITFTTKKPAKIQSGQWNDRFKAILKSSWNVDGDEAVLRRLLRVVIENRFSVPSLLSGFLSNFVGVIIKLKIKSKL